MTSGNLDLFSMQQDDDEGSKEQRDFLPLAARMRPRTIDQYIGQEHILAPGKPLRRAIDQGICQSLVLWGPPGTGKTTLAEIIARHSHARVEKISAVTSGIKEIRAAIDTAEQNRLFGRKTILFVDEVHRFNKSQQDAFLPYIENGTIFFIGATTENPSFELNNALLSRLRVYIIRKLDRDSLLAIVNRALTQDQELSRLKVEFEDNALDILLDYAGGDGRRVLNFLEALIDCAPISQDGVTRIGVSLITETLGEKSAVYDKKGDSYYDYISALHKSIRGSNADGALYWYARIVAGGGDPLYVARRLLAIASEDIGNADPNAMRIAINAWDCFERVGAAEGERAIAQAIIYMAAAPKSNAVYVAWNKARQLAAQTGDLPVPLYLRNAPTKLMEAMHCHEGYRYAHDEENAYAAGECYLPPEIRNTVFYEPNQRGMEIKISEKLARLRELDRNSTRKRYPD